MKEILIASGKGGTGKTSVAASFIALAGYPVAIGDCDVDAANLALLVAGTDQEGEPFYAGKTAKVDPDRCSGGGDCYEVCRYQAIGPSGDIAEVDSLSCEGCGACNIVCRYDAIRFSDNRAGTIYVRDTEDGPMVHAALGIAQDNSGKLVARVRTMVRALGEKQDLPIAIIDGPPGISCPVHASLSGADLLVAVTEPTASGFHDLERLLILSGHFGVKSVVIINKWDLNPGASYRIEELTLRYDSRVVGRLPFCREVPSALSEGNALHAIPAIRQECIKVWKAVEQEAGVQSH